MEEETLNEKPDLIPDIIPDVKKPLEGPDDLDEEFDDDYEEMYKVIKLKKARKMSKNVMEIFYGINKTKDYIAHTKIGSHILENYSEKNANMLLDSISTSVHVFTTGAINKDDMYDNIIRAVKKYSPNDKKMEKLVEENLYSMIL